MLQVALDRKRGVGPPILSCAVAGCVAAMRGHGSRRPCGMLQVALDRKRGVGQSKHDGAEPLTRRPLVALGAAALVCGYDKSPADGAAW